MTDLPPELEPLVLAVLEKLPAGASGEPLPPVICMCDPTYGQSCPACDGTLAELQPDDLGEACIAYEHDLELCPRRAETGSPYCLTHQYLATDRLVAA